MTPVPVCFLLVQWKGRTTNGGVPQGFMCNHKPERAQSSTIEHDRATRRKRGPHTARAGGRAALSGGRCCGRGTELIRGNGLEEQQLIRGCGKPVSVWGELCGKECVGESV